MAKRSGNGSAALDPALSQKKRARRRLIGAAAVALAAAIVLPLILDSEPRQHVADVEVEIPSRDTPLQAPSPSEPSAGAPAVVESGPSGPVALPASPPESGGSVETAQGATVAPARPGSIPDKPAADQPAAASEKSPPVADTPARAPEKPAAAADRPAKAAAVAPRSAETPDKPSTTSVKPPAAPARPLADPPQGDPAPTKPEAEGERRVVLQIGAYAKADSARTMMERARKAGVRAYTENVQTAAGPRTRVRVGPFTNRDSAERARGRLKLAGIDSSIVPLQP